MVRSAVTSHVGLLALLALAAGCGTEVSPGDVGSDARVATDASLFDRVEPSDVLASDAAPSLDARPDAPPDVSSLDALAPDAPVAPYVPTEIRAEVVFAGPAALTTPASWNAHLPKLARDDAFVYAVHTHFTDATAARFAVIARRPAGAAAGAGRWTEVARVLYPHQPPGVVMDTDRRLHMVFDCLRPVPTGGDVTCFQGGAGTAGRVSRFYHLVFSSRDATGALRFDAYANFNEWTAESLGYHGLGTTADGVTYWSLADASWNRVVQSFRGGAPLGTVATLARPPAYLLYPVHAADPLLGASRAVVYLGEFDPSGGSNAGYLASIGFAGDAARAGALVEAFRRAPATPAAPGTVGAFPSDVAYGPDGTLYVVSYRLEGPGACTELLRFDGGVAAAGVTPRVLPAGCLDNYATLQVSRRGVLYLVAAGASGRALRVGISADRGERWTFTNVPVVGVAAGDTNVGGVTPLKPYTSPRAFDPDRFEFFFTGTDASNRASRSYYGVMPLRE